jgi:hypothetical protein
MAEAAAHKHALAKTEVPDKLHELQVLHAQLLVPALLLCSACACQHKSMPAHTQLQQDHK